MPNFYVDPIEDWGEKGLWCHLWTDGTDQQLDQFAAAIGLRKQWAHLSNGAIVGRFYHYDLRPSKRALALQRGAVEMPLKEWVKSKFNSR